MKKPFYTEISKKYIFSLYYSIVEKRQNRYRNHYHTEIEIGYVQEGMGTYIIGGKAFEAQKGDIFIIRSNEQHCMPTITSDTLVTFNIRISPCFFWDICSDYISADKIKVLTNSEIPIGNKIKDSKIALSFKALEKLYQNNCDEAVFQIRSTVLDIIKDIATITQAYTRAEKISANCVQSIQKAMEYIKHNYKEQLTLESIAKSVAISPSYLSNSFKTVSGMSPYNYLTVTRIEKAIEKLKDTDKTVLCISQECGFTSLTSFNKAFKKITGITPVQTRNGI